MAVTIKNAAAARAVLDIAESYEKVAKHAKAREIGISVSPLKNRRALTYSLPR
jgi:hypothetical protein